jgi:peptide-methionine (S)-S-oxide reductase
MGTQKVSFGMGCFWGAEETFSKVNGVVSTAVGYMGGNLENPTYEQVCTGKTGHAETLQLEYDPEKISYEEVLEVFWNYIDPTSINRQGPDYGTQYRSVIFYHSEEQKILALKSEEELEKSRKCKKPIVTQIVPASTFYRAEEYHQRYFEKHGGSCHI